MNEYNIFENGLGDAHEGRNLFIHVSASIAEANFLASVRINSLKHTFDSLVFHLGGLLCELKGPYADHVFTGGRFETELNLTLCFGFPRNLWVVDEAVARPSVRWQLAGAGKLQALNDGLCTSKYRDD